MRNKYAPKRGGNTGRNASNRSTPKKDNEPDKSKGSPNHMFSSGRSEDFQPMASETSTKARNSCIITSRSTPCTGKAEMKK